MGREVGKEKGHGNVHIPDSGAKEGQECWRKWRRYVTRQREAQHPPSLLFWGFLNLGTHTSPPHIPALGDLLCQLLEADGSPFCGGPVGAFPDMGVPRVRLGREDHGHYSEGAWFPLGDVQDPWGLMAAWPRPPLSP